jgi:hypothetical protein
MASPVTAQRFYRARPRRRGIANNPINSAHRQTDARMVMLSIPPPMSNRERQRRFRERNPGYYGRLHAKRRAKIAAALAEREAVAQILAVKREPLMLPAPVETIEIPGMTTIEAIPAREKLAVLREAA